MTEKPRRIVVDTNVFVSAALYPNSPPGRALANASTFGTVLTSASTWRELLEVIQRPKFDRIIPLKARQEYLESCVLFLKFVDTSSQLDAFSDCRDPDDNKFLALALSGHADLIITGDTDLLSLNPWRGIPILTPSAYLDQHS